MTTTVESLVTILKSIPSPVSCVDHETGYSFDNTIKMGDSREALVEKAAVWYNNMIPDADEVYPGLFIGNAKSAQSVQYLKDCGIDHVLNCAEGKITFTVKVDIEQHLQNGIKYLGLKCNDVPDVNISTHFDKAANFIDEAIRGGGKVLVNCFAGFIGLVAN